MANQASPPHPQFSIGSTRFVVGSLVQARLQIGQMIATKLLKTIQWTGEKAAVAKRPADPIHFCFYLVPLKSYGV
jgi:hypothetical protein